MQSSVGLGGKGAMIEHVQHSLVDVLGLFYHHRRAQVVRPGVIQGRDGNTHPAHAFAQWRVGYPVLNGQCRGPGGYGSMLMRRGGLFI